MFTFVIYSYIDLNRTYQITRFHDDSDDVLTKIIFWWLSGSSFLTVKYKKISYFHGWEYKPGLPGELQ